MLRRGPSDRGADHVSFFVPVAAVEPKGLAPRSSPRPAIHQRPRRSALAACRYPCQRLLGKECQDWCVRISPDTLLAATHMISTARTNISCSILSTYKAAGEPPATKAAARVFALRRSCAGCEPDLQCAYGSSAVGMTPSRKYRVKYPAVFNCALWLPIRCDCLISMVAHPSRPGTYPGSNSTSRSPSLSMRTDP